MGDKLRTKLLSFRDLLATAWPILLIVTIGFIVAYQFVEPAPPRTLTISTGGAGSGTATLPGPPGSATVLDDPLGCVVA